MERKQIVEIFKALADETRLGIVKKLADESKCLASCELVSTCASAQQLSQPAMSHHFNRLVEVGVVLVEKRGTQKVYTLNRELLDQIGIDVAKI